LYADVKREALLWSLVAAPVDSLEPKEWCYPIAGCAAYRGYFDQQDAQTHAARLASEGWDTAVLPVPAYSTLGWFSDPMPSTVIGWPLPDIAGLVFHELAHESLYLPGDSTFNESYATVIEQEGVRRWLQRYGSQEQRRMYALAEKHRQALLALIEQTRARLEAVYETDSEREQLLRQKAAILQALRERYLLMREGWDGFADYDRRFDRPFNNADIASFNTYHALVPAFRQILVQVGGDMAAFQAECRAIAAMQPGPREAFLQDLLDKSVGP
jgi:predicted aminopeptidase